MAHPAGPALSSLCSPRRAPARFAAYGLAVGLAAGVPAGIGIATSEQFLRDGRRGPAVTRRAPAIARPLDESDPLSPFNLDGLLVDRDQIVHGGPPKDGIPSLSIPQTVVAAAARFLRRDDRVVGVVVNGQARAYPIRLLNYHEVVNDELGDVPIAVVFCPLCDSVTVIDRRLDEITLTFGVSGLLHNSNVLMYDRLHNALWSQLGMRAISGPFAGRTPRHLNSWEITSYGSWAERHPAGTVISLETGHRFPYDVDPYAGYVEDDRLRFPVAHVDARLPRKAPVIGIRVGGASFACSLEAIRAAPGGRLEALLGSTPIALACRLGATDDVAVMAPEHAQTTHTFWFAWAAFHPETELVGAEPAIGGPQEHSREQ